MLSGGKDGRIWYKMFLELAMTCIFQRSIKFRKQMDQNLNHIHSNRCQSKVIFVKNIVVRYLFQTSVIEPVIDSGFIIAVLVD